MAGIAWGIFGGTFDPVHLAHLALAEEACGQLRLDRVLWVPAGEPWRKADRTISDAKHRAAMVELAIRGDPRFELCMLEIERSGPSYSVDTLAELGHDDSERALYLLLGQDALDDLPNWREPERLLQLATLAVAPRGRGRPSAAELDGLVPGMAERVVWLEMPRWDVNATELRDLAAQERSLSGYVPTAVQSYIQEHGLYRQT